jgi:prolyl-tRNA editing enzyme YbaK/EbsC (Cys-tRNA(Pro) deacylase)
MWPEPVERVAEILRRAGVQGRLEELLAGAETPPGTALRAEGFECDGRLLVALVPAGRALDETKLTRAAGCGTLRTKRVPDFPFQGARVLVDRSALVAATLWLDAGSPRHVLGLPPGQLAQLTHSETADLLTDD